MLGDIPQKEPEEKPEDRSTIKLFTNFFYKPWEKVDFIGNRWTNHAKGAQPQGAIPELYVMTALLPLIASFGPYAFLILLLLLMLGVLGHNKTHDFINRVWDKILEGPRDPIVNKAPPGQLPERENPPAHQQNPVQAQNQAAQNQAAQQQRQAAQQPIRVRPLNAVAPANPASAVQPANLVAAAPQRPVGGADPRLLPLGLPDQAAARGQQILQRQQRRRSLSVGKSQEQQPLSRPRRYSIG